MTPREARTVPIPRLTRGAVTGPATPPMPWPARPYVPEPEPSVVTGPATLEQEMGLGTLAQIAEVQQDQAAEAPRARRMTRREVWGLTGLYAVLLAGNGFIYPVTHPWMMAAVPYGAVALPVGGVGWAVWRQRERLRSLAVTVAGAAPWPLLAVLTVQAVLSLRLVWSNTAFGDEALYLWAGHLEWAHWLHGTPIPAFPTYFSGAPVLYPPLGAIADTLGGLAAARILGLAFMLAATCVLWSTAARLFGKRAAFFSIGLWATAASTQFLGAFATYDPLSLLLMTIAAWCAVHVPPQRKAQGWLAASAITLVAANATKYASGIFDPLIASLAVVTALQTRPWKQSLVCGVTILGYATAIFVFLFTFGGTEYWTGVTQTTLARAAGTSRAATVLNEAWQLTAVIVVLALAAVVLSSIGPARQHLPLIALLTAAALLVPLEQARIHTTFALHKHLDFGAWFAAVAAGYAVDLIIGKVRFRHLRWILTTACATALVLPSQIGLVQAKARFNDWPNSASLTAALHRILPGTSGPILVSTPDVSEYYLPEGIQWYRWSNLYTIRLLDGRAVASGVIGQKAATALYERKILDGFFAVVVINLRGSDAPFSQRLLPILAQSGKYRLTAAVPYWRSQIWLREPQQPVRYDIRKPSVSLLGGLLMPVARQRPILWAITSAIWLSGLAVLAFMITVRLTWRRGKASDEA